MPFDPDLTSLIRLRQQMGAPIGRHTPARHKNPNPKTQIVMGLGEITPVVLNRDMFEEEVFPVGGLLTHLGVHKTLHIYDPFVSRENLEATPAINPKFHLADCVTLETMRSINKYDRYVVSNQTDGLFPVRAYDHLTERREQEEILARIQPCKNCLKELDYEGFDGASHIERRRIFEHFDLMEFFATYETMFRTLPRLTRQSMGEGQYTSDWAKISARLRREANWTCSECAVNCSNDKDLLHVHHRDGNRGNNRRNNLQVLCIDCHSKQPAHSRLRPSPEQRRRLDKLRDESLNDD